MFEITCNRCGAGVRTSDLSDPDAALICGCCPENHHHGQNAAACPGIDAGHPGTPCHRAAGGQECTLKTPSGEPCPGGHCGPGVAGCNVCRPITISVAPNAVKVS